jgi:hypothetical protein
MTGPARLALEVVYVVLVTALYVALFALAWIAHRRVGRAIDRWIDGPFATWLRRRG